MHVLEPGWEVPDTLPAGVTVAPAADPRTAARVIAERVGGELVVDVAVAEQVLARESARRRAAQIVADAAEATRLCARLDELSAETRPEWADAEQSSLLAAAARVRAAVVTAEAAARVVGDRPSTTAIEIELVRARSLVSELTPGDVAGGGAEAGALAMSAGGALLLASAGVPVVAVAVLPAATLVGLMARSRRAHRVDVRLRAEAAAAAAAAERAHAAWVRAVDAEREWQTRADAAAAARAELDAARAAWVALVGSDDVPVEHAERLVDAARKRERLDVQTRLRELLHGRRLDRLQAEADAARAVLAVPTPPAMVLCDPFAGVGRHRRREFFEDLERAAAGLTLAVVTSDDEAFAWASSRARAAAVTAAR